MNSQVFIGQIARLPFLSFVLICLRGVGKGSEINGAIKTTNRFHSVAYFTADSEVLWAIC